MTRISRAIAAAALAAFSILSASVAGAVTVQEKAALQAAMQRHIDRQSVDGVFLRLDEKTGDVLRLYPATAHPKVMKMGEHFVLCFDFRNKEGKKVEVDFYMARKDTSFTVFHTTIARHDLLYRLINDGKITAAN